jgi:hypothetical protein
MDVWPMVPQIHTCPNLSLHDSIPVAILATISVGGFFSFHVERDRSSIMIKAGPEGYMAENIKRLGLPV